MATKKALLQRLNDLNVSIFWKVKAKNLSIPDLQKLVELKEKENKENKNVK